MFLFGFNPKDYQRSESGFMDIKSVTTWTQMVADCKKGKNKKLHNSDLPASV